MDAEHELREKLAAAESKLASAMSDLTAMDARLTRVEDDYQKTLMAVLKGLKGGDDGTSEGLYENVRRLRVEQASLHEKVAALHKTVSELNDTVDVHEKDKQRVIGGGYALWLTVSAVSALVTVIITMMMKK